MKWIEVIEFRSAMSNRELLETCLPGLLEEAEKATPKQAVKSYRHVMIDTDFIIQLSHDSPETRHRASPLGLRLASALKEFGLVKHSIWVEMQERISHGNAGRKRNDSTTLAEREKATEGR